LGEQGPVRECEAGGSHRRVAPMSPGPRLQLAVPPAGCRPARKGTLEKEVIERVRGTDGFWHTLKSMSKATGIAEEDLQGFAEQLCGAAYAQADEVASSQGALKQVRDEVAGLKQKLQQCNLSAIKQISASKAGAHAHGAYGDDTIMFHEPLQYLDEDTKELVLSVICEKIRLLEVCNAPPSLVEALEQHAAGEGKGQGPADEELAEELETSRLEVKRLQGELSSARVCAEDAVAESSKLRVEKDGLEKEAEALKDSLLEAQRLANGLRDELAASREALVQAEQRRKEAEAKTAEAEAAAARAREALEELREEFEGLQREHEELQQLSAEQQAELERKQAELDELGEELARERAANEELRAEVERTQQQLMRAQQELQALQARFDELEAEANALREELARRNRTRTMGTQTTTTGQKLDDQAAETKKLKMMLEELQMKMKELVDRVKRKGMGKEIAEIAEELGLQDLCKAQTVFERLYDDAVHRVNRLEKLRERIRKERHSLQPASFSGEPAEASVADAVAQSELPGLQSLLREARPVGAASPKAPGAAPAAVVPIGLQEAGVPPARMTRTSDMTRTMRTVTSLPSLTSAQQAASVITLGYGAHGGNAARQTRTRFF